YWADYSGDGSTWTHIGPRTPMFDAADMDIIVCAYQAGAGISNIQINDVGGVYDQNEGPTETPQGGGGGLPAVPDNPGESLDITYNSVTGEASVAVPQGQNIAYIVIERDNNVVGRVDPQYFTVAKKFFQNVALGSVLTFTPVGTNGVPVVGWSGVVGEEAPVNSSLVFDVDRLVIDEAGMDRATYYGKYANETIAPANPNAGVTYTHTVTVSSKAAFMAQADSTLAGQYKLIQVSTGNHAGWGEFDINNVGAVAFTSQGAAQSATINGAKIHHRGGSTSWLDMSFQSMNGAGSKAAFNYYTPEHKINGCNIQNTSGIFVGTYSISGEEGGAYVFVTNNTIEGTSGTTAFISSVNSWEKAADPGLTNPVGFHLLYNDILDSGASSNAVVTSEGIDFRNEGNGYHVIAGNYIRDALKPGEDEVESAKTDHWLAFHNLVVDCDNGHFSCRVGPHIYNFGNTILPSINYATKGLRQLGSNGKEYWLVHRANQGLLGAGSPVSTKLNQNLGMRFAPRVVDYRAGTSNSPNIYNTAGASDGEYFYNLMEGCHVWAGLEIHPNPGNSVESFGVNNVGANNIYPDSVQPVGALGILDTTGGVWTEAQWIADNPNMLWEHQIRPTVNALNDYQFSIAKQFDFNQQEIDWDPDPRSISNAQGKLSIGPGPYWERAVKMYNGTTQVWGVGV
ncbi:MAG: hypothetical protein V3U84_11075, partial [Thiotrichaceae bacterium]